MARTVAMMLLMMMQMVKAISTSRSDAFGLKTLWYMFLATIPEADNMDESVEDMTAADTAPRPKKATAFGVRYCKTAGTTIFPAGSPQGKSVFSQLVPLATAPK